MKKAPQGVKMRALSLVAKLTTATTIWDFFTNDQLAGLYMFYNKEC